MQYFENQKYINSENYLQLGSENLTAKYFYEAILQFKKGLTELGYCYLSKNVLDDTGNWITIPSLGENAERFGNSARILQKVLTTRIRLYEKKEKC